MKTAAQGWKLEQILRCHEQHPSFHQMSNDFQPQIEAGHQAQETVKAYANWLVTTINDALPQDNWTIPSPHPSAISIGNVDNLDRDYEALVNSVERHTKCSTAYCIKIKPGQQPTCRFNFPKDCQDETIIDFQLITKAGSDDHELTVEQITQAQVKATLTQSEMMDASTPTTVLCYNTGEPMQIFKPLLTLTSASGTWQNTQQKVNLDHSPHLKYSLHVLIDSIIQTSLHLHCEEQ